MSWPDSTALNSPAYMYIPHLLCQLDMYFLQFNFFNIKIFDGKYAYNYNSDVHVVVPQEQSVSTLYYSGTKIIKPQCYNFLQNL